MTDVENLSAEDRDALAGELAFGVLEGEERAAALRLVLADRDFATRVERWRDYAAGLFDAVPEVTPPGSVWQGIDAQMRGNPAPTVPSLRWWRAGAIGSAAVAAGLAAVLLWRADPVAPPSPATQQFAVAQLSGPIEGLRIATRYEPTTARLHVRASGMPETPTEPELWVVPPEGEPISLGQIRRDGDTLIIVPQGHRSLINPASTLQLSMEPPADQPSAAPTAPMVATGAIDLL